MTLAIWMYKMTVETKEMTRKALIRKAAALAILAPAALLAACAQEPAPAPALAPAPAPAPAPRARG